MSGNQVWLCEGQSKVRVGRRLSGKRRAVGKADAPKGKLGPKAASHLLLQVLTSQCLLGGQKQFSKGWNGLPSSFNPPRRTGGGWNHPSHSCWQEGNRTVEVPAHIKSSPSGNFLLAFPGCLSSLTRLKGPGRTYMPYLNNNSFLLLNS